MIDDLVGLGEAVGCGARGEGYGVHAGSFGGGYAVGCVFDDEAVGWIYAELTSSVEKNVGLGLGDEANVFDGVNMGTEEFAEVKPFFDIAQEAMFHRSADGEFVMRANLGVKDFEAGNEGDFASQQFLENVAALLS